LIEKRKLHTLCAGGEFIRAPKHSKEATWLLPNARPLTGTWLFFYRAPLFFLIFFAPKKGVKSHKAA